MGRPAALIFVSALLLGCGSTPFGEVLVVVDTDAPVPQLVGRLRLDLYTTDGTWYDSRDIAVTDPAQWPLSFGLYTDDPAGKSVRARLRAYPDRGQRDYRGERPPGPPVFVEPHVASSIEDLCQNAPALPPYTELTQRRGPSAITEWETQGDCKATNPNEAGSVAARIEISTAGSYRFEVVRASPDGSIGILAGDTTLFLRSTCSVPTTQLACNDDIDTFEEDTLSRLVVDLQPGSYTLMTGGVPPFSPADLTLRWGPAADWIGPPVPVVVPVIDPALPRLVHDGIDVTPSAEPQPALAIDRLLDVTIDYGERKSVKVVLSGECLGTQADLVAGTSCVDTVQTRVAPMPLPMHALDAPLGTSRVGTWTGAAHAGCTTEPRSPDATFLDEEVCVPGGAFILGSDDIGTTGGPSPRQTAAVAPFLVDRYEVTVARYRRALAEGFAPQYTLPLDLVVNDGALFSGGPSPACAYNGDATGPASGVDRERFPLNCISWRAAREFCQYLGEDLPTHVQWEYAATAAGRDEKTLYPWGNEAPDCERARYDRASGGCAVDGDKGPVAVDAEPWADGDQTPLGIVGLGGNVAEWALDSMRPYTDACWWQHTLYDVGCTESNPTGYSQRGASWMDVPQGIDSSLTLAQASEFAVSSYGFRCVRPGAP